IARIPPPSPGTAPTISDLLLAGYQARITKGYDAAAAPLRGALAALRASDLDPVTGLKWFLRGAVAARDLWDDQAMLDITYRWGRLTRRLGALTQLPIALVLRALAECAVGRLDQAANCWIEMREIMAASQNTTMIGIESGGEGLLLAYRGDVAKARAA